MSMGGPNLKFRVASLIQGWSHTFVEIDHELIFTVILLPSDDSFNKGGCHMRTKY